MIELAYAKTADLLQPVLPSFVGDPPENIPPPYAFVWGPLPISEALTAAGCDEAVDTPFNVTVVAKAPPEVLRLAAQVKETAHKAQLVIDGWNAPSLKVVGSTPVQTARSVVNDASNTYPAWIVLHVQLQATKEG